LPSPGAGAPLSAVQSAGCEQPADDEQRQADSRADRTLRSWPATVTVSARCSPGGWPSPATSAAIGQLPPSKSRHWVTSSHFSWVLSSLSSPLQRRRRPLLAGRQRKSTG